MTLGDLVRGVRRALVVGLGSTWREMPEVAEVFPGDRATMHGMSWAIVVGDSTPRNGDRLLRPSADGGQYVTALAVAWSWRIRASSQTLDVTAACDAEQTVCRALVAHYPVEPVTVGGELAGGGRMHIASLTRRVVPIGDAGSSVAALVWVGEVGLRFNHPYDWAPPVAP